VGHQRRTPRAAAAAVGVVLAVMAGACSLSGAGSIKPLGAGTTRPTSNSPTSTITAASTSTTDPTVAERQAVLDTYRASWAAGLAIAADSNGNPNDPALAQSTADPLLTVLRANLAGLRRNHLTEVGPYTLNPVIVNLTTSSAAIEDCLHDQTDQVNVLTGVHTPPIYPNVLYEATVTLTAAGWRVTDRYQKANTCAP
jgi:hypothetical protein